MDKFGRNYILEIGKRGANGLANGEFLIITPPFTIEFDIIRNTLSSANIFQIRVFNLSQKNRDAVRFNTYEYATYLPVRLRAGYGDNLAVVCQGNIHQAWSVREGVNFITQMECFDGGFAYVNGQTNRQFPSGTQYRDMIKALFGDLPNVKPGVVGNFDGQLARGNALSGNTAEILTALTGGGFFIDSGKANALKTNEYIATINGTTVVNAKSGLLGTPILENNIVRFDMLFEPALNIGQRIELKSLTESKFNGFYQLTGVKHRGMISDSVCGSLITTGEFVNLKEGVAVQ